MSKHKTRRKSELKATAKDIVVRLAGDGRSESFPHAGDTPVCALCGATLLDVKEDAAGNLHTVPAQSALGHRPDCAWRMAFEYVQRHPKRRQVARA
jgi:hypothetical protein